MDENKYQLEDLKEESFEDFVIQNENFDEDEQPLRIKNIENDILQHQFSQISRDHTSDGMNRNSLLPTKNNTQYGG